MLAVQLAECIESGMNIADASMRCGVSVSHAKRVFEDIHGGLRRSSPSQAPEFASGLALHLYEAGFISVDLHEGAEWDALLDAIRLYLKRHRLMPPGARPRNFPGSSGFSRLEQMAMVNKYIKAVQENRSTVYIGSLFMQWGITAAMMDKWRQKYLGKHNPHVRNSQANKQRRAVLNLLKNCHVALSVPEIMAAASITETMARNRLRELCRVKRIKPLRRGTKFVGYQITDAGLCALKAKTGARKSRSST